MKKLLLTTAILIGSITAASACDDFTCNGYTQFRDRNVLRDLNENLDQLNTAIERAERRARVERLTGIMRENGGGTYQPQPQRQVEFVPPPSAVLRSQKFKWCIDTFAGDSYTISRCLGAF